MKISLLKGIAITALLFSHSNNFVVAMDSKTQPINIEEAQTAQLTGKNAQAAVINNTAIKYFAAIVGKLNCHVLSSIKEKSKKNSIKETFDNNKATYITTITDIANDKEDVSDHLLSSIIDKNAQKITKELKKIKDVDSASKFYATMEKYYASEIADSIAINDDNLNIQKNILQLLKSVVNYMNRTYGLTAERDDTLEGRYNTALKCALEVGMLELIENICKGFKDKGHIVHNIFAEDNAYNLVRFKQLQEELSTKIKTAKSAIHDLVAAAQISRYDSLKPFENNITVNYKAIKSEQSITKIKTVEFNEQKARESDNKLTAEESAFVSSQKDYRKKRKSIIAASRPSTEAVKSEKLSEKKHLQMVASNGLAYRLQKDGLYVNNIDGSGEGFFNKKSNTITSLAELNIGNKKYINDKLIKGWAEKANVDGQTFVYLYTAKGTKIYLLSDLNTNTPLKKLDSVQQFFTIKSDGGKTTYTRWTKGKRHYESTGTATSLAELIKKSKEEDTAPNIPTVHAAPTVPATSESGSTSSSESAHSTTAPAAPAIAPAAPAIVPAVPAAPAAPAIAPAAPAMSPAAPAIVPAISQFDIKDILNKLNNGEITEYTHGLLKYSTENVGGKKTIVRINTQTGNKEYCTDIKRAHFEKQTQAEPKKPGTNSTNMQSAAVQAQALPQTEIDAINLVTSDQPQVIAASNNPNSIDNDQLICLEEGKKVRYTFKIKGIMPEATREIFNETTNSFDKSTATTLTGQSADKLAKILKDLKKKQQQVTR